MIVALYKSPKFYTERLSLVYDEIVHVSDLTPNVDVENAELLISFAGADTPDLDIRTVVYDWNCSMQDGEIRNFVDNNVAVCAPSFVPKPGVKQLFQPFIVSGKIASYKPVYRPVNAISYEPMHENVAFVCPDSVDMCFHSNVYAVKFQRIDGNKRWHVMPTNEKMKKILLRSSYFAHFSYANCMDELFCIALEQKTIPLVSPLNLKPVDIRKATFIDRKQAYYNVYAWAVVNMSAQKWRAL